MEDAASDLNGAALELQIRQLRDAAAHDQLFACGYDQGCPGSVDKGTIRNFHVPREGKTWLPVGDCGLKCLYGISVGESRRNQNHTQQQTHKKCCQYAKRSGHCTIPPILFCPGAFNRAI